MFKIASFIFSLKKEGIDFSSPVDPTQRKKQPAAGALPKDPNVVSSQQVSENSKASIFDWGSNLFLRGNPARQSQIEYKRFVNVNTLKSKGTLTNDFFNY